MATWQASARPDAAALPVPEVPAAYRPRDPALHALRQSEQREIQLELAQLRAEREQLAAQRAELDARAAAIDREVENRVVAASANVSTAFCTPEVPSAPPGLVMHFANNGQHPDHEFQTPDGPNEVSLTPALEEIPTPIATPRQTKQANLQVACGGDPDPDLSESSSGDDDDERRRKPISVRNDARELAPVQSEKHGTEVGCVAEHDPVRGLATCSSCFRGRCFLSPRARDGLDLRGGGS